MAGPLSALHHWWNVSARLRLQSGDRAGAQAASQEALWIARRIAEMTQLDVGERRRGLVRALEQFADLRDLTGDTAAAQTARQEAAVLRSAPIPEPD